MLWIDDDTVTHALESGDDSNLVRSGVPFCISQDSTYCVLAREHEAWLVPAEGWRDANTPPATDAQGRLALNFYKRRPCAGGRASKA